MSKVLIVEDCQELAELLSLILPFPHFVTTTVSSKADALDLLKHLTPDVIVWDIDALHESGRNALIGEEIPLATQNGVVPLIMLSTDRRLLHGYQWLHADAIMEKPFNINGLVEKINSLLYNHSVPGSA